MKIFARKDVLTGLWNRNYLEKQVERFLKKKDAKGCFFIMDIDDFKQVNDNFGHAVGDSILIQFAEILKEFMRKKGIASRSGGDEFILFFRGLYSEEEIEYCAKSIIDILHRRILYPDFNYKVNISIGISKVPEDGRTFQKLYINADRALYFIKRNGKNSFCFYRKGIENIFCPKKKGIVSIKELKASLKEITEKGSYSISYAGFQNIYQFLKRNEMFEKEQFCILLFTLEGEKEQTVEQEEALGAMVQLENLIHQMLGKKDVSANYSNSQHLIMLSGADRETGSLVAGQISRRYLEERKNTDIALNYWVDNI